MPLYADKCFKPPASRRSTVFISGGFKMNYFEHCKSVEEAKRQYKKLLMQYHPDHAGPEGENITKEIIRTLVRAQFNAFLNGFMSHSFNSYYEDKEWKPKEETVYPFQEVLQKIINLDCQIEIIGYWIY
jgi:hypothetical protein